jgi:hypothetical protein
MPATPFHEYEDLALSPTYVLGYAFHGLNQLHARSPVHGRQGALGLLTELFATLTALKLEDSLRAAEPLRLCQETMASTRRSTRVGSAHAAEVRGTLTRILAAVQTDLSARAVPSARTRRLASRASASTDHLLTDAMRARCPESQRFDLMEGCRALASHLPTASVFHLYRVWEALGSTAVAGLDVSMVADPRTDPTIRCEEADAIGLLSAIQRSLDDSP